ncbi:MAG: hypothetical protein D6708_04545 [Candidatus Dadabacteria bacterium]|nr:MAG: hypothetical protein D6708_04545 [Candidatus Dadabacteria bacterium]
MAALVAVALTGWSAGALADQGIRGRVSHEGTLVEGLVVRAYPYAPGTFGPLTGEAPAAEARTATDGTYRIELPPGRYVVEGLAKAEGNAGPRPEPGDLWCLYAGSPVVVTEGARTAVGLNLVRVPREERQPSERSRIEGVITFQGEPVEKCYLSIYADPATAFRGPARQTVPVRTGAFRVAVPPGTYYLVARKRARGGSFGPIEIGDRFNFYAGNPLTVGPNETVRIEIPLVERLSQLEEDPHAYQGVPVIVTGPDGNPAEGYYVLAYTAPNRAGPPLAVSAPTDAEGKAHVPIPPGTAAYLRARKSLGGPLAEGEAFGDAEVSGNAPAPVTIRIGGAR